MPIRTHRMIVAIVWGLLPSAVMAGYDEALAAHRAKDYDTALREARLAADAGDARASYLLGFMLESGQGVPASKAEAAGWYEKAAEGGTAPAFARLAQLYARGDGVPKDPDKAIEYARRGDRQGDPGSSHFLHVALISGPLRWIDAGGKPDQARYRALAARPVSERNQDIEAYDALYRSASRNYPPALFSLALTAAATLGDGSRERLFAALAKLPPGSHPALKRYEQVARHQARLGQTYTTPQLFLDAQLSQGVAAMIQTCGIRDPKDLPQQTMPELQKVAISRPLGDAVFLPSHVPGYERAYLVAGTWEETWTYRGCDKTADVIVEFTADGLGGATMTSRQNVKTSSAGATAP